MRRRVKMTSKKRNKKNVRLCNGIVNDDGLTDAVLRWDWAVQCAFHRHHFGAAKQTEIVKWPIHSECFNVDSVQRIMWHFDKNQENWTSSDDYTNGNYHYTHPIENLFTYNTSRVLRCFCLLWSTQYTNKLTNHRVNWTYQVYSYRCYQSRCDF